MSPTTPNASFTAPSQSRLSRIYPQALNLLHGLGLHSQAPATRLRELCIQILQARTHISPKAIQALSIAAAHTIASRQGLTASPAELAMLANVPTHIAYRAVQTLRALLPHTISPPNSPASFFPRYIAAVIPDGLESCRVTEICNLVLSNTERIGLLHEARPRICAAAVVVLSVRAAAFRTALHVPSHTKIADSLARQFSIVGRTLRSEYLRLGRALVPVLVSTGRVGPVTVATLHRYLTALPRERQLSSQAGSASELAALPTASVETLLDEPRVSSSMDDPIPTQRGESSMPLSSPIRSKQTTSKLAQCFLAQLKNHTPP